MEKINILGTKFNNVTTKEAVLFSIDKIKSRERMYVVTPNAEISYEALHDSNLQNILNNADLVLADGIGVVLASKILKTPLKQKVAGVEYAEMLVSEMAKEQMSLYILGGKPGVAELALENLMKKYKGLIKAGAADGYFKDASEAVSKINKANADVLFVCLGAPKQENFISANLSNLNVKLMCGIGGSADVFAGTAKRAPKIFIKLGLEWFYRLIKTPSRAGRMIRLPKYIIEVFKWKRGKK